jgi:K+-transporting ATPase c subunit
VESIVKARKLNADGEARVRQLIDRLAEQPSSRLVGEEHVNLLRLNLALDAL